MILVAADDVHTMVVGSLKGFQHKLQMVNDPAYREEQRVAARRPTTLREMLGVKDGYQDSEGTGHLVLSSMSEMFGTTQSPMRESLGLA
jgi:hypothetical protein